MINETFGFNLLQNAILPKTESGIISKEVQQLIANLKLGDYIEGALLEKEGSMLLKLANGISLPIQLMDTIDIGKLMSFVVVGKEGQQLILQPKEIEIAPQGQLTDKIISEFQVPNQAEMKIIISQFLDQQLPLNKESLLTFYRGHQIYNVPTEVLVNLKESQIPVTPKEIQELADLRSVGVRNTTKVISSLINNIQKVSELEQVMYNIGTRLSPEMLSKVIQASLSHQGVEKIITIPPIEENLLDRRPLQRPIIERTIENWFTDTSQVDTLEKILSGYLKEESKVFCEKIIRSLTEHVFKEYLQMDFDNLKNNIKESEKITDTSERLEVIAKQLEKLNLSEEGKEKLQQVNQTIQTVQKYNIEAQYFCFPIILKEQESTGELYFFKPKKKQGTINEHMYIVMALNMPTLQKVEVHIEQTNDTVDMILKVELEVMKQQIESALEELLQDLKGSGYHLNKIQVKLFRESKEQIESYTGLYHMDLKA